MSYGHTKKSSAIMVQYTKSSTQSLSDGDVITFNTKKTTGSDGTSVNSSTGVIALDSSRRYWVQASISIEMSANDSFEVTFQDSAGNNLDESDGVFPAYHKLVTSGSVTPPFINHSYMASLVIDKPSLDYKLVATFDTSSSHTCTVETNLLIIEIGD